LQFPNPAQARAAASWGVSPGGSTSPETTISSGGSLTSAPNRLPMVCQLKLYLCSTLEALPSQTFLAPYTPYNILGRMYLLALIEHPPLSESSSTAQLKHGVSFFCGRTNDSVNTYYSAATTDFLFTHSIFHRKSTASLTTYGPDLLLTQGSTSYIYLRSRSTNSLAYLLDP
jgi:hypothetical protein